MIELDVQHSADGALVVLHDDTVDRTTDGTGCVGDLELAALQALDAAAGTSLAGTGVTLPTLAEALGAITVDVNVEIKLPGSASCPAADRERLAADVVAAVAADAGARRILVSSFDLDVLKAVQQRDPALYLGYLTLLIDDAAVAAAEGFAAVHLIGGLYAIDDLAALGDLGIDVNVWTVDEAALMRDLFGAGVSVIITDEPDLLEATRAAYCTELCGP
jgi:glycerophosphoryl diester phosphodiesterase